LTLSEGRTLAAGAGGPILDGWTLALTVLIALGLLGVAVRARSAALAVFAAVFSLVAIEENVAWHGELGARMASRFDLSAFTRIAAAPPQAWGEFLVLTAVAAVGAAAVLAVLPGRRPRRPLAVLTMLLGLLFLFAAVADLLTAARPDLPFGWVEELGELAVLSVAFGYVSGLVALDPAWLGR